jgi:D-serine deaminase-like pyridoxal phosphate-dependent protein
VDRLPGLTTDGLIARVRRESTTKGDSSLDRVRLAAASLRVTREAIRASTSRVPRLVLDFDGPYRAVAEASGVEEVILGRYALVDTNCLSCCPDLLVSARVLSTVTSRPVRERAILDAGQKALSSDEGLPVPEGLPDAVAVRLSAEHCRLDLGPDSATRLQVGDKTWLIPGDVSVTTAVHDHLWAAIGGQVVARWPCGASDLHA